MKVLVGYASSHGSTMGIAEEIGDRLARAGLQVDLQPITEMGEIGLDVYGAVVLGSAIHTGRWLPEASAFVQSHAAELAARPVWLFSVCSIGETSSFLGPRATRLFRRMQKEPKQIAAFRQAIGPRDHRRFAGAIERSHWNVVGDLFLRMCGGSYGDHRDWKDIDAWADSIARELPVTQET